MERMENQSGGSKSSIVPLSRLQGTANYNSSLCGVKTSIFFLLCFGFFFSLPCVSQWADWFTSVHLPVCLSACLQTRTAVDNGGHCS